jgi:hypothetical protein
MSALYGYAALLERNARLAALLEELLEENARLAVALEKNARCGPDGDLPVVHARWRRYSAKEFYRISLERCGRGLS